MSNVILNYAVKFNQVESLPAPSFGFLKSLGAVVLDAEAPEPSKGTVLVNVRDGDLAVPATLDFAGNFAEGDQIAMTFIRDVEGIGGAEYNLEADGDAFTVAEGFADFLNGNTGIQCTATGSGVSAVVEILAIAPNSTVTIDGAEVRRASPDSIIEVTSVDQLQDVAPNDWKEISGAFDAGMNSVYIIPIASIADLPTLLRDRESEFYTVLATSPIAPSDFINNSTQWEGVRGFTSASRTECAEYALDSTVNAFYYAGEVSTAYQQYFAFGEMFTSSAWRNQQYVAIPEEAGSVTELGVAESLFTERTSFVLTDDESGTRLGFFVAGGKSMTTPYTTKQLELEMQFEMTNFLTVNQPFNTELSRAELARIGNKKIGEYIDLGYLDPAGVNEITITDGVEVFTVDGTMTTAPAIALWRVFIDAYQTQG